MARQTYYPERGDIVHLNFSPAAQYKMAAPHYGLILSTSTFARKTGFALICPITSNTSPWAFNVALGRGILPPKAGKEVDSVILTDQVKSLDFRDRACEFIRKAPDDVLDEALAKVRAIIDSDDVVDELRD